MKTAAFQEYVGDSPFRGHKNVLPHGTRSLGLDGFQVVRGRQIGGPTERRPATVRFGKIGVHEVGTAEVGMSEVGAGEVGTEEASKAEVGKGKVGNVQAGTAEVGNPEVGKDEPGIAEVGMAEVGAAEVGKGKVGTVEVDTAEVGIAEVGIAEVGTAEVGYRLSRLTAAVPFDDALSPALEQLNGLVAIHASIVPYRSRIVHGARMKYEG